MFLLVGAKKRDDIITFLWSLYHEYGHLLQENPNEAEQKHNSMEQYTRETDAWNKAEQILSPTQIFQDESRSFFKFRGERLKSYL